MRGRLGEDWVAVGEVMFFRLPLLDPDSLEVSSTLPFCALLPDVLLLREGLRPLAAVKPPYLWSVDGCSPEPG